MGAARHACRARSRRRMCAPPAEAGRPERRSGLWFGPCCSSGVMLRWRSSGATEKRRRGTTVQRVRVHVGVIGFVGLSLTLGPGLHDLGSAAPRAETVANADDYFPDAMGSRWRYRGHVVDVPLQK